MIILREYKVSDDGKNLIVDVQANPSLQGVYLDSLHISCDGTFTDEATTNFDNLILLATNEYTGEVIDWESHPTQIRLTLPIAKAPYVFGNKMFHLKVTAQDPEQVVSSCCISSTLRTATFYKYPLYKYIACSAHQMDSCDAPQVFIDYLMKLKALEASIAVGDISSINEYFDWLIAQESPCDAPISETPKSGCGCLS